MNIEKIKNFSKEEQKALEYFEMLRNVIVERDSEELDEMINQISKGNLQKYTVGEIICFKKILKELLEGDD